MGADLTKNKATARWIARKLNHLYPDPKPPLTSENDFQCLVAVLLSAQTTDARVNLVTPDLFRIAPTPEKMAGLSEKQILKYIRTCGLAPTKAKNVKKLSEILVRDYGGQVPHGFEKLESLPGVGHKTASVVMCHVFQEPAFPVDTHIHRLAKKWGLSEGKNVEQVERDLKEVFPKRTWNHIHLQMIFYGREHCTARGCNGRSCLLCAELMR
jgi:endonuclease-3